MFFLKKLFHSFHSHPYFQYPCPSSPRIWTTLKHCDVNIMLISHVLLNQFKIRSSVNSSIAGTSSMTCWPVNRKVMQIENKRDFLSIVKMLCIYYIDFILGKMMAYNNTLYMYLQLLARLIVMCCLAMLDLFVRI